MKLGLKQEIGLNLAMLAFAALLLIGLPIFKWPFLLSALIICVVYAVLILGKSWGDKSFFAVLLALPLIIIISGTALKLTLVPGGAFLLFIALTCGVISVFFLFMQLLLSKDNLQYLRNSFIRLLIYFILGIVVYFTPSKEFIKSIYKNDEDKRNEYLSQVEDRTGVKDKKQSIIFVSGGNIKQIEEDGRNVSTLLQLEGNQWAPRVQGQNLFFLSDHNGFNGLYKKNLDDENLEFLDTILFDDFYYNLSKSGEDIIYHDTLNGYYQIFSKNLESGEIINLSDTSFNDSKPIQMNDGRILFQRFYIDNWEVFSLDTKGIVSNLTNSPFNEQNPEASPYNDVILYHSDKSGNIDLYYQILESGEIGRLTESEGKELIGRFSPNAKTIVYGSDVDGNWEIYTMKNDGTFLERLTFDEGFDGDAIWISQKKKNAAH